MIKHSILRCKFFPIWSIDLMQNQWKFQQIILWIKQADSKVYIEGGKSQCNVEKKNEVRLEDWQYQTLRLTVKLK